MLKSTEKKHRVAGIQNSESDTNTESIHTASKGSRLDDN